MKIEQMTKCTTGGAYPYSIWAHCTMLVEAAST